MKSQPLHSNTTLLTRALKLGWSVLAFLWSKLTGRRFGAPDNQPEVTPTDNAAVLPDAGDAAGQWAEAPHTIWPSVKLFGSSNGRVGQKSLARSAFCAWAAYLMLALSVCLSSVHLNAQTATKQLYLSDPSQALDRISPVATGDATTATTAVTAPGSYTIATSATTSSTGTGTTLSFSHTPGSASNRLLLVGIGVGANFAGEGGNITSVTFGGVAMTQVGYIRNDDSEAAFKTYLFALANPSSAAANVVITASSANTSMAVGATTFSNVDISTGLTSALGAVVVAPTGLPNALSPASSGSATVSSATGQLVYSVGGWDEDFINQSITTDAGQTELWKKSGFNYASAAASTKPGAASVTVSYTAGNSQEWGIVAVPIKPAPLANTATFTQAPTLCSPLQLPVGGTVGVSTYISVTSGAMPSNPSLTATLRYGATTFATLTNPTYNSGTGLVTWSGALGSATTVPAGQAIVLTITNNQSGVAFDLQYDSQTKPSEIDLPVTTFIDVVSADVYNTAYPGGNIIASAASGSTKYVRAVVTDPFGFSDITGLNLTISPPGSNVAATSVATSGCTRTYEYVWTTPGTPGTYSITATAKEGYEDTVVDTKSASIDICTNCPPVAVKDTASGPGGEALTINVLANDYDPNNNLNPASLAIVSQPMNGSVSLSGSQVIYLPNGSFQGVDSFKYKICDLSTPTPLCDTGTVVVTITEIVFNACIEATATHVFYVPFPEQDARTALIASGSVAIPSGNIRTVLSLMIPYPGTTVVWDHWEDGYEANPQNPVQSTTRVWGDGNPYNGIAPGYPDDIIPPGGGIVLDNTMPANPRNSANIFYDGRDKIISSGQITMTQALGEPSIFSVQAMKTNISSVADYGKSFTVPAGQNFNSQDFKYTALFIRASENNTLVQVDKDNNGSYETTTTLNEGQSYLVNGGVLTGATVIASKPIGIDLHWGGVDSYSSREVPIFPATWYSDVYYTPVPTTHSPDSAVVMLYNPLNRSITINWSSGIPSSGSITLPAKTVKRFPLAVSSTAAYKFVNPTGESFVAIEIVDSYSPNYPSSGNQGSTYDWSFNLISMERLTDFATVAWAPGSIDGTRNDNPIWVTPVTNTTIYVKYDGDLLNGGSVSPCGMHYNVSYTVNALNHKRILDSNDNDQSRLSVFTCDGTKIAVVYGEDPSSALTGNPSWDVGSTLQPFCLAKLIFANDDIAYTLTNHPVTIQVLTNDAAFMGAVDPLSVVTTGLLQPSNGTVSVNPDGTVLYTPNNGFTGVDTFEYRVCTTPGSPPQVVCDVATVVVVVNSCPTPAGQNIIYGQIFRDKNKDGINNDGNTGFTPGKVYLYVDANCNTNIDANELADSVSVDSSGAYQFLVFPEKVVADNFNDASGANATCATGSDGTAPWLTNWVDAGDPSFGFCVTPAQSAANTDVEMIQDGAFGYALRFDDLNRSATRQLNMQSATAAYLSFSYRRASASLTSGENVLVQMSTNGSSFTTIYTIFGSGATDAEYVNVYNQNITAYNTTGTTYVRFRTNGNVDEGDYVFIDNVSITYEKYPICYITQVASSTLQPDYYFTTPTQSVTTANSGGTCYGPFDFGVAKNSVTISGTLYNDPNGLTDAMVNGTPTGTPSGVPMYAYLVDGSGQVIFKVTVNNVTGAYSFPQADVNTNYTVVLSTTSVAVNTPAPTSANLPAGWASAGDAYGANNGAGTGNEADAPNSQIAVNTSTINITGVNFGIQKVNAGPDKTVCQSGTVIMGATTAPGIWFGDPNNPGDFSVETPTSPTTTISDFSVPGTYYFIWTYNGVSDTAKVTVNVLPDCSITGAGSVCTGSTGNIFTATAGMSSYAWSISGNGTISGPSNEQSVNVTAGAPGTFTVTVVITDSNGCTSTCDNAVTVNALPTCNITGANAVCAGSTGNTFSTTAGMSAYAWSISGNGTISGASNAQTVSVSATTAGTFTVTVILTNASGCTSTCNKVVTVNANPVCDITGASTVCSGSTSNSYSAPAGMSVYAWSITGNGTISGAGNTQNVSVNATTAGTFTVSLTITNASGCTSTCNKVVTVSGNPTCDITGANAVCASSTGNTFSAPAGMGTYAWSISGNGTINGASNAETVSVNAGAAGTFTVSLTITIGGGCTSTCNKVVTVNANPACNVTGASAVCAGSTGNTFSATAGMSAYSWSVSGNGTISGASNGQTVNVTATTTGTFTVTVALTNTNGCTSTCNKVVTVNANPVCNITGANAVCTGSTGNSFSTTAGMSSYAWSISGNGTISSASNAQNVSVTATSAGTFTVTVVLTNASGCTSTCNKVVTVNANPACDITGPDGVCSASTGNAYSAPAGMSGYAWSISGNGTISGATNTQNLSVTAAASGTFTVSLTVTNASGCTSTCSKLVTINANPTCNITGPDPVVTATTGNIYSAPAGMSTYAWSISGNGTINGASNQQNVDITAGAVGTYDLTLTITNANGCSSTCSRTITVESGITCSISGADAVCTNSTGNIYSAPSGMTSYAWSITFNGTIIGQVNQQTVSVDATGPGSFTLSLTIIDPLNNTLVCNKIVTVNSSPVCSVTGPAMVSGGSSGNIYTAPAGMSAYSWSITGNGTISGSGSNQTVSITAGAPGTYTVTLDMVNASGCSSSCSKQVTVVTPLSCDVSGDDAVCANTSGHIYSGPAGLAGYAWSVSGNGTIDGSTTGQTVSVSSTGTGQMTVSLTVMDAFGNLLPCNKVVTVNPNPTCNISGPGTICTGSTSTVYSAPAGMTAYAWSISGDGTIDGPSNQQDVSVEPTSTGSFALSLVATNSYGCTSTCNKIVTVDVNPPCNITGANAVCAGSTGNTYDATAGMSAYAWSVSGNATISGASDAQTVSVNASTAGTFTVYVTITNANGCTSTCSNTVTVNANPACDVTGADGVCAGSTGNAYTATAGMSAYSWSVSGNGTISGASNAQTVSVNATTAGTFTITVIVTDANGCTSTCNQTVTVFANPTCNISGASAVCAGSTGNSFAAPLGMSGYAWSISGNGTINGASNAQTLEVDATTAGTFTISLTIVDVNGCTSNCSEEVTVHANPACDITGASAICANSTGNTFTATAGMSAYSWSVLGNGTINGASNAQTVSVDAASTGTFTVYVTVTDANGCTSVCSNAVTVNANPACNVSGPNTVCAGSFGSVFSAPTGMTAYAWSISGNGAINGASDQQSVSVDPTGAGTFTITVITTNANGCTSTCNKVVTVAPLPVLSTAASPEHCLLGNDGAINLTVASGTAPFYYDWSNDGPDLPPGADPQDISGLDGGTYSVTVTDTNGCIATTSAAVPTTNCVPDAQDDIVAGTEDVPQNINVLVNDDFGGDGPSVGQITIVTPTVHGTAVVNTNGTSNDPTDDYVVYTPDLNYNGPDVFVYQICDANGDCDPATVVSITLNAVNDPPVAHDDAATTSQATPVTFNIVANDTDIDGNIDPSTIDLDPVTPGQQLSYTVPGQGTFTVNTTTGDVTFTPLVLFYGPVIPIPYAVCDDGTPLPPQCDQALILVTVTQVNGHPNAVDDQATTPEDTPVNIPVLLNDDFGPDGPSSGPIQIIAGPLHGTAMVNDGGTPNDPTDDTIDYIPDPNFYGQDLISYEICDANGDCDLTFVTITVTPVNDPPVAVDDPVTTPEDTPVTVCVLNNDSDVDGPLPASGVMIIAAAQNGTAVVNSSTGCITYTPNPNYTGPDTIQYKICDADTPVLCDTAYVLITVTPVNDPPVAVNDTTSTPEDTPVTFNITSNDTDTDGAIDPATVDLNPGLPGQQNTYTVPDQGTFTVDMLGNVTFTPVLNFNGAVTPIGYSVCDTGTPVPPQCDQAVIYVTVTPVNDPPVAVDDPVTTPEDVPVTVCVLGNDSDVDGNISGSGVMVLTGPQHGTYTLSPITGCITYTPAPNYNGPDTIQYKICDTGSPVYCDTAYVIITVTPVNDLPNAVNDGPVSVTEDTPTPIAVLINDTFGGDGPSTGTITLISPASNGTVTLNDNGTPNDPTDDSFTYTPNLNYNGPDQFTYQICDSNGDCDLAVVTLNVTLANDPPVANNDNATTPEDTPVTVCVLDNDTDPDGNIGGSGVMVLDGPQHGVYTLNPVTGCITYTPALDYNGPDTMRYKICDTGSPVYCDTAYVFIEVGPINDLPDAVNDVASTNEDTPVTVPVLTNDTFGGDGPSTSAITVFTNPSNGTAVVTDGGTPTDPTDDQIVYTPNLNYTGPDQFIYQICDSNGDCDVATVNLTINPVNDPLQANKDMATTPEDTPVTIPVLNNDTDPDNNIDPSSVTVTDAPEHGTATVNPDGSIMYTPDPNYNGPDTLIYNVCDTGMPVYCDTALVVINVTPANDLPDAVNDVASTNEDTPVNVPVLTNDTFGGDGPNTGTISVFNNPLHGTAVVNDNGTPTDPTDDYISYTPALNYNGPDQFTYQICDANGDCDVAVVNITVNPVNDPPVANRDDSTTPEDTPLTIPVLSNDTDPDNNINPSSVTVTDAPNHGTASVNPGGSITYTPDPNYNGPDTLIYQVCDTGTPVYCDTALVVLNMTPVNDPPVANDDYATTPEDTPVTFNITANDTDTDGAINPATVDLNLTLPGQQTSYTVPGQGTFTVDPLGNVTFTPALNFNGAVTPVPYSVCDNGTPLPAQCDQAIIYVTVTPVNDPPVANDDNATTQEDTPVTICVLTNDYDVDGPLDGSGVMIIDAPNHGVAGVIPATGCILYTPALDYYGPDTLRYKICDADGLCDTAYVFIEIGVVNDLPDAVNDATTTNEDTPVNVPVLINDTFGGDGPSTGQITVFTNPAHGTAVVNTNSTPFDPTDDYITYTPNLNYNGPDQFTYQICDSNGDCDVAVVNITINPVNDPPVANRDNATTPEDTPVTILTLNNDTDPDGNINPLSVTVTDPPNHGTASVNPDGSIKYTPDPNYNGPDTLVYQVCDTGMPVYCDTALVVLNVTPANDPPTANDDYATTPEDTPVTFNITSNDTDTDGSIDPATIDLNPGLTGQQTSYTVPGQGTFTVNLGNGDVTFTPALNFTGTVTPIGYGVCDNGTPLPPQCAQATIYVTVTPVNDPPVANNDNTTTPEDTPVTVCVTNNDTDPDGNLSVSTVMVTDAPNHGSATVDPLTGCITYTPAPDFNGLDTLYYKVCDTGLPVLCDTAYVIIKVTPLNDLPDAKNDMATTPEDTPVDIPVLSNDTFGGDGPGAGQINVFTNPSNGTAVVNTNGTPTDPTDDYITYTPNPNFNGADQFTYQICDANGDCDVAVVNISVIPVNDPPVAVDDPVTTPEDTPVTVCVLGNDSDTEGPLAGSGVMIIDAANHGSATLDPVTGCITYTPNPNYTGPDTIQYKVCDAGGLCDTAYVLITIKPVNDPPVANDDYATTPEDTPVTFNITTNDTDTDGAINPATVDLNLVLPGQQTSYTVPGQGAFTVDPLGNVTFTPVPNFNGAVTPIGYSVCDTGTPLPAQCAQAIIYVTVTPVNDPPVAVDDPVTTPEDTPVTVCVLTNDSDVDGPLSGSGVMIIDPANHGTGVLNPVTGCILYTPAPNYNGPDTIQYKVCDAGGLCDTAYVIITVLPVNDLPDAKNDVATTPEDTPVNVPVLTNDTFGGDGPSTGTISVFTLPLHGTAVVNDNGTPTDPTDDYITYTPAPNYNGPDQFNYQICDSNGDCDVASVALNVTPVNDPPVATDDPVITPEDTPVTICVLANDSDPDGPLAGSGVMIIDPANHGTGVLNPSTGCIVYTPTPNYNGPDTIQYKVCDGTGLCDTAYVIIDVLPVNDLPNAVNDNTTTTEDTPKTIPVLINDTFGGDGPEVGSITLFTPPSHGTAVVDDNGTPNDPTDDKFIYTPALNYTGLDQFNYEICDANGDCDLALVRITITPVNDPPVANDDPVTTPEDTPVTVCVLTNDTDVDNVLAGSGVMILTPANHGTGVLNPVTGCIVYTPAPNYNGPDTIQYKVCDAGGLCDTAYVIITVTPVNDLPDAVNDLATTNEDTPVNIPVLTNDTFGGDGPSTGAISAVAQPLHGTVTLNDGGTPNDPTDDSFDYTPAPNYNGPDQFTYRICDANGDCDLAVVNITVTPVNDPPVADDDPLTTPEDTPVTVCVLNNDSDVDGPLAGSGVMIIDPANHGTAVLNPVTGCITYTPAPNYNGPDTIQYKVCDTGGLCDTAYVIINVTPVNDLPDAVNDLATTPEDAPVTVPVLTNDTFGGDGPSTGTITLMISPLHGTATLNDGGTPNDPTDDTFTYTPAPNYNGPDQFTYQICDANGDCDDAVVSLSVTPVNDPPVAVDDPVTTPEDTPVAVCVLNNDTDADGSLAGSGVMIIDPANHGSAVLNPVTGCIAYTPDPNYNGPDTIQYKVCDAGGLCDTAYVIITVTPVNDPPTANDDNATTPEDTPVTFNITANDTDTDGVIDPGTIDLDPGLPGQQTSYTVPGQGTFTVNLGNGDVTFTPVLNFNGAVTPIAYSVCDNGTPLPPQCDQAAIYVTVTPENDPPVAVDDPVTTPEDLPLTVCVLNNDSDVDGPLAGSGVMILDPANYGAAVLNPLTGCITYTPDPNYNGPDTIQYKICDAGGLCDTAYVIIDVLPLNDPPVVQDNHATTPEDTPVTFNIIANDSDTDGNIDPNTIDLDPLTPGQQTSFTVPSQGTFTVNLSNGDVTFTPAPNFSGTVTPISYAVCDDGNPLPVKCGQAQIYVTVTPDNDPPVAVFNQATTPEDTPVTFNITNNDTDSDGSIDLTTIDLDPWAPGQQLTYTIPGQGVFTANLLTGEVTFTPEPEFSGTVNPIAYQVCDTGTPLPAQCDTAAIYVTVTPVNDPPVVQDDYGDTNEDTPITFNILTNDSDIDGNIDPGTIDLDPLTPGQQTTYTIPGQGTFTVNLLNGDVTFTPAPNFDGTVVPISYSVCDDGSPLPVQCGVAQIYLSVIPVNDPPVANNDYGTTPEDTPVTIPVLGNDTDPDDNIDPASVTVVDGPDHGTATVNPDGSITYTPDPNYNGPDTLKYSVCDTGIPVYCDMALVILNVTPVNDPPVANDDNATTPEDTPVTFNITSNDTDIDGAINPNTIDLNPGLTGQQTSYTVPGEGTFTVNLLNGDVTFTPAPNFNGPVTPIAYQVCDTGTPLPAQCAQAAIYVTVTPANDPPSANDDPTTVLENTPTTICVLDNDSDPDGPLDGSGVMILDGPNHGTAVLNPLTSCITYTPDPNYDGPDTLRYKVCDAGGLCDTAIVPILVQQVELQVTKTGVLDLGPNGAVNVGDVINYTITVLNAGDVTISNIYVTDPNADPGSIGCTPAVGFSLAAGASATCSATHTITQADIDAGSVTNTATANGLDPNGNPVSDDSDDPNDLTNIDPDNDGDPDDPTVIVMPCVTIEAWVYLEGAAIAPTGAATYALPMRTDLNNLGTLPGQVYNDLFFGLNYTLPGQPYNVAPWNYNGTEGAGFDSGNDINFADAGYTSTVVDWVLVSLRDNPNGTGGPICQAAALLHSDGHIEFVDDFACCDIDHLQDYYLVIEHRNHLIVMSHQPISIVNNTITYDFRTQQSYINDPFGFGVFAGQKEILPGVFAMYGGNGNQTQTNTADTDINFDDRTYWEGQNGDVGQYRIGDYNLNGDTNFNDRRVWELNNGKFTSVPRN